MNHGNFNSGILLNPSEQDSRGKKADLIPIKSVNSIKPKSEKKKKKDRLSMQDEEGDAGSSSPKEIPNLGKKRGSLQFTDDIYLQIEQDSSSVWRFDSRSFNRILLVKRIVVPNSSIVYLKLLGTEKKMSRLFIKFQRW